jgi:micrococcal nuclease
MRRIVVLLALLSAACGITPRAATTHTGQRLPAGVGVVSKEVDGDTVHVQIGGTDEKVRFIGIDTPETHGRGGLVECFGQKAADHTARLIPVGTKVRLVRDAEARDRYGRLLAYVYRADDDLFVNLALARDGYADVLTYPPNVAHTGEFVAAVADARDHNRGLWSECGSADVPIDPQ